MDMKPSRRSVALYQLMVLLFGTTWLFAPTLNNILSYRTTLISQYETSDQPYAWLFRIGDVIAAGTLILLLIRYHKSKLTNLPYVLLGITAIGLLLDPLLQTTCHVVNNICVETLHGTALLHAVETLMTSAAFCALVVYDALKRHRAVSVVFFIFQLLYGVFFFTHIASNNHFNTASQFLYQTMVILWLVWYIGDYILVTQNTKSSHTKTVRRSLFAWVFLNGIVAIITSLAHIRLLGRINSVYFAANTAWLAQHGVIVGVIMLYVSRHLLRGEQRARLIMLIIFGLQIFKYSVIVPHDGLLALYLISFAVLFVQKQSFIRGSVPMTWRLKVKDLLYVVAGLVLATLVGYMLLIRDNRLQMITTHAIDFYTDYAFFSKHHRVLSALLAHTISALIVAAIGIVLWILFSPRKVSRGLHKTPHVEDWIRKYANSPESFFMLWPNDKRYFWNTDGFVAYKIVGSSAIALADPVAPPDKQKKLLQDFISWTRTHGLTACFLPVQESSLSKYDGLESLQIGSAALINIETFTGTTRTDKWWRWKRNKISKQGYNYEILTPPHANETLKSIKSISDDWLAQGGHKERGFLLGYYDEEYMQKCRLHVLRDVNGKLCAFVNELPTICSIASIDLLRYTQNAQDTMPYLLDNVISSAQANNCLYFDLGFVPFAGTKGPVYQIAQRLSTTQFSAKGLEQFKNKFDPVWQAMYIVFDGDVTDLGALALNISRAMKVE